MNTAAAINPAIAATIEAGTRLVLCRKARYAGSNTVGNTTVKTVLRVEVIPGHGLLVAFKGHKVNGAQQSFRCSVVDGLLSVARGATTDYTVEGIA